MARAQPHDSAEGRRGQRRRRRRVDDPERHRDRGELTGVPVRVLGASRPSGCGRRAAPPAGPGCAAPSAATHSGGASTSTSTAYRQPWEKCSSMVRSASRSAGGVNVSGSDSIVGDPVDPQHPLGFTAPRPAEQVPLAVPEHDGPRLDLHLGGAVAEAVRQPQHARRGAGRRAAGSRCSCRVASPTTVGAARGSRPPTAAPAGSWPARRRRRRPGRRRRGVPPGSPSPGRSPRPR